MGFPALATKRYDVEIFFKRKGLPSLIHFCVIDLAWEPMGTTLSLEPFPITLTKFASRLMSWRHSEISSETLKPAQYMISIIAQFLSSRGHQEDLQPL